MREITTRDALKVRDSGGKPVVLCFFEYWSMPTIHFVPEIRAVAERLEKRALFYWIPVDENPGVVELFNIEAIPATLIYKKGVQVGHFEGPYSQEALEARIKQKIKGVKK